MVRGKNSQGNEKITNLSSSDGKDLQSNDDEDDGNTLPRGGSKKNYSLSSFKPDDEQKIFPTQQHRDNLLDEQQQQQLQPQQKRGRGRPRKIPITTTITNNDIDQNSSSVSNSESSSSKIILNHRDLIELDDNLNDNSNDDQHNIISVIEIVDESQDNSIANIINNIETESSENILIDDNSIINCNLDYSNESQTNQHLNILEQQNNEYNNNHSDNQLQNDTNSIEENINRSSILPKFNNNDVDDNNDDQNEIIKNEPTNFDIEAKINTESIITISSEENSNFKSDTPITELIEYAGGSRCGNSDNTVSSPDILHVHINPNSARTYQNKRKSKIDNDLIDNYNNSKLNKDILELNQLQQNNIIQIEDNSQIPTDNNTINIINNNSIECRRSSRKKTMKYDVRDLLNKNRKKIQIEARIDSLPKKPNENSNSNDIKLPITDNNNCKLSPILTGIPKINELHDIIIRKSENQLQLNDKTKSPPTQLVNTTNFQQQKNLIQIQTKKSFENNIINQLPPPPPLKSIADLDRKIITIPMNGLYPNNELNNKIYSFQDAFNSGIIKGGDNNNKCQILQSTNSNIIEMPIKTISSTIVSSTQSTPIPPPVLSSMVKSPLLNIKFKHQNLAIRKSFDNLINANSTFQNSSLNDSTAADKNTFQIESQLNINDQKDTNHTLINEKPIKVKGKRGRPPKNKSLSPKILDNSLEKLKQANCKIENLNKFQEKLIKFHENHNLIQTPSVAQNKKIENSQTDNKIIGKLNYNISTITNNADLSSTNTHYFNAIGNFKLMESKVKIKRLSSRSSTESFDNNTNNKNNDFTDLKKIDVIGKSNENDRKNDIIESDQNKTDKIIENCNHIIEETNAINEIIPQETAIELQNISKEPIIKEQLQNIENEFTSNTIPSVETVQTIVNTENVISTTENNELQVQKYKLNKVKDENILAKLSPTKKKRHFEFDKIEKIEKTPKNLREIFKTHSGNKKKPKDILTKESSDKLNSSNIEHLQESVDKPKPHKEYKKNLENNKDEKTIEKSKQTERKINLPQQKLFLETEKIHEIKLQKLERKKSTLNKEHTDKFAFKKLKKIEIGENSDQTKNLMERKEMNKLTPDTKISEKLQEQCNIFNNNSKMTEESDKEIVEILENEIISNKSKLLNETEDVEKCTKSAMHGTNTIKMSKSQKDIQVFEKLAEKLIDNEISSLNCNEHIPDDQNNEVISKFEENLTSKSSLPNNTDKIIEVLEENKIDTNIEIVDKNCNTETIIQQDEKPVENVINQDNCLGTEISNIRKNEISDSIFKDIPDQKVITDKNQKTTSAPQIPKEISNECKTLPVNSSNESLSASPSTDSNDPLKDIEKFLEAADNLLSRSLSSEDEKDPTRRRGRTGTRFKDCGTKDDGDDDNDDNETIVVDGLNKKNDKETVEHSTCSQMIKDDLSILKSSDEFKCNLDTEISQSHKEDNKVLEKTENLEKPLHELTPNQISVICGSTLNDYQNILNTIKSEQYESNNSVKESPTLNNEVLNFSHKFPSQETSKLSTLQQPIEKRTPGPRTPPFPPPIDVEINFLPKSEESLLNIESNCSSNITGSLDFHSDSMTSNSSKSTDSKNIKIKTFKKIENDIKLIKKLKRKDEKKLKKKDGITDELKRTIKEMQKIKKTADGTLIQSTLSKAAMKSYSPINSIDNCKTDGDSRSLDDILDLDENQIIYDQNNKNIRRSHRIKTITKSQSVGRGLVRDRERYDKEYDDIKPDLAVIDAQNAKFLKDMEERLSQFQVIRDNEYKCERIISKEAKKMICDCFLTREEEERGEFGCGEDCLNRLLMIECGPKCTVGDRCTNRRFQRAHYAPCKVFQTEKKGCGIMADAEMQCGQFIMEYVGEVLNSSQFEKRAEMYSQDKNKHYYFMALRSDAIIDATTRGNISRFINHSCDPNAETQKWTVNGELRIGFFTTRTIVAGEEITFDYQFQRYGKEAQRCYCETSNCRGWIGEEPDDSDEEELEDESDDDEKNKTDIKKEISQKIIKELPNDQQNIFKPKSVQEISQKTDTDVDKENIELIKTKPDKKEKKKRGRKKRLDFRLGMINYEFIEDPDLEDEVLRLLESGLKNQVQTLCLSRLFVRAKQLETRLNLLQILRKGEMSCRRLFLDYHGLKLLHGWMSETTELVKDTENDIKIRLNLLETLECLPIPNKTMLKDSKVFQTVQNWSLDKTSTESSPNDGSPNDNSNSGLTTPINVPTDSTEKPILLNNNENLSVESPLKVEIKRISIKLITIWDGLPEVFRIPRRERVEQMKEHEREADKQYAALKLVDDENEIRRNRGRFIKEEIKDNSNISNNTDLTPGSGGSIGKYKWSRDIKSEIIKERRKEFEKSSHGLSKLQRRQIFAAKVAQVEAEKRLADEKREFDIKCKFYGLDPLTTHPRDFPFCVNPATGQWYTMDRRKIPTPPSHAHIIVPPKPQSTKPEDYQLPALDLPPFWKFAIDPHKGRIYYYHVKIRIPQWEPPIKILPLNDGTVTGDGISGQIIPSSSQYVQKDENDSSDSGSESGDSINDKNKDDTTADGNSLQPVNPEQKKMERKKKRYALLVQEKPISPRREEDRVYNQIEMRRYKENKEKIRRRKEEIKRRKIQLARQLTDQQNNPELETDNNNDNIEETESLITDPSIESDSGASGTSSGGIEPLPIADYLLSSDEEETISAFCDAKLIEKIVKGEKIVDELDALNINRPLKRLLSFKEKNISSTSTSSTAVSSVEHKSKKLKTDEKKSKNDDEIKKPKSSNKLNNPKYLARKAKEKFRADIAGIIVLHLTPYRKDTCKTGKITRNEDFKHLARKLTHFVMVKELKHCDLTGQQLIVTDSVKNKSREFIKKYMAKYGEIYIRPENDPEFKEIPH